jgi:hypothetical protein
MDTGHADCERRIAALERRIAHLEADRDSLIRAARATTVAWADIVETYEDQDLVTVPDAVEVEVS